VFGRATLDNPPVREFYWEAVKEAAKVSTRFNRAHINFYLAVAFAAFLVLGLRGKFDVTSLLWAVVIVAVAWCFFFLYNLARGPALVYQAQKVYAAQLNERIDELARWQSQRSQRLDLRRWLAGQTGAALFIELENPREGSGAMSRMITEEEEKRQWMLVRVRPHFVEVARRFRDSGFEDQANHVAGLIADEPESADEVLALVRELGRYIGAQLQGGNLEDPE
jgi:hypothetical protein